MLVLTAMSTTAESVARAQAARRAAFWRHVLVFGVLGGLLVALLKWIEYRWLVVSHSVEIYGALVAAVFAALGIWLGLRLTRREEKIIEKQVETIIVKEVHVAAPSVDAGFVRDEVRVTRLGLTPRELEILALMAEGLSNREMADRLFVSENTIKTHSGRVFDKLDARRRTQAVQRARDQRLIP